MKAIINGIIINNNKILKGYILCFDKTIVKLAKDIDISMMEVIDAKGNFVSAGFIDLHIHGINGYDVMDSSSEALENISKKLINFGVTSFLATTMSMSYSSITKALENIKQYKSNIGANILGVHLEGPFINHIQKGAQDSKHIKEFDMEFIEKYVDIIEMITLAPEVYYNMNAIREFHIKYPNIILSIGHSNSSYDEAIESFDNGISHATHLFNAMKPYHHREPNIIGAVFDREDVTCDVIADLIHTHKSTLNLVQKIKKDKLILISDSIRASCLKNGFYDLGGQSVEVKGDRATLSDGTLAGSMLTLNKAVLNMVNNTNMRLEQAIYCVTKAPSLKLNINKGELKEDYDADVLIFDNNLDILMTIIDGSVVLDRL